MAPHSWIAPVARMDAVTSFQKWFRSRNKTPQTVSHQPARAPVPTPPKS